jgi:hypothetical protein
MTKKIWGLHISNYYLLSNFVMLLLKIKLLNFKCKGIATFELMGSSGKKEEVKTLSFNFIDGSLQDLNNIDCIWSSELIKCTSNFLNVRNLEINLKKNTVTDFISGNKGFGQYVETFSGDCENS